MAPAETASSSTRRRSRTLHTDQFSWDGAGQSAQEDDYPPTKEPSCAKSEKSSRGTNSSESLDPNNKRKPKLSTTLATVKYTNVKENNIECSVHPNRLKSKSAPVFPKKGMQKQQPQHQRPTFHQQDEHASFISPIDIDTQRLRQELDSSLKNIHILEPKHSPLNTTDGAASSAKFPRDALKYMCPSLFGDLAMFSPTPWLQNAHLQTAFVQMSKPVAPHVAYERELVTLSDGATIGIDWYPKMPPTDSRNHDLTPIILLVHGLNGSSGEGYVKTLATFIAGSRNYRIVAMNYRGCGNTVLTTPEVFDGVGGGADVAAILEHIRTHRSTKGRIVAVGWSLGGNMILNYLAETTSPLLTGSLTLSPTFDISQAIDLCSLQTGGIYSSAFAVGLQAYLYQNWCEIKNVYDVSRVFQPTDLRDLAECFFGKAQKQNGVASHGTGINVSDGLFADAALKLKRKIADISVPTLVLASRDDPITKPHWAPLGEIARNHNIVFATTASGGHIGWFEGNIKPSCWANRVALEWIDFVLFHTS
ncbi:Alpha/Beta hydrolase protein [Obelidium mucronatum]|nr:Alpha/Beta hydrolase protein [Obelidium mucronatum]